MRDQRRRKMAFYGNSGGQEQGGASGDTPTNKTVSGLCCTNHFIV